MIKWGECWHDSLLDNININYDDIVVRIERNERTILLKCKNFLGIEYLGQWDENIIRSIQLLDECEIINKTKEKIQKNNDINSLGGGIKDFNISWKCLNIELLDSVTIRIVCEEVTGTAT